MSSPKPVDVKMPEDPTRWPSPRPFSTDDERYARGQNQNGGDAGSQADKGDDDTDRGEKLVKPNKVYIGGLPDHTRREDLQSCFGKIGNIVNIELKLGYGFVEFDTREAAEESVAKYHEGYFMGQKIKVELSRGGGRTAKYTTDPGACFKCGEQGHWARECPNYQRRSGDPPVIDRAARDPPPPPRDYPPPREDYGRYPPPPPARDPRYGGYEYPPPPGRRPPSPREYRDYPPPSRGAPPRDYYDDRIRGPPGPPPPPPVPPPGRYDTRPGPAGGYYANDAPPAAYPPRGYGPPPPARDPYDRYERGGPPPARDRFAPYPPPGARPRSPPGVPPPRGRDEYDRGPPRDFRPPPVGRPSPPRFADYGIARGPEPPRYRRRSQSPPPRGAGHGYYPGPGPSGDGEFVQNPFGNGPPSDLPRGALRDYSFRRP